jgi:hypothetical protein
VSPRAAAGDTIIVRLGDVPQERRQRFASTLARQIVAEVIAEIFGDRRDDPAPVRR